MIFTLNLLQNILMVTSIHVSYFILLGSMTYFIYSTLYNLPIMNFKLIESQKWSFCLEFKSMRQKYEIDH